jgi:hypothetical protein
MKEEREQNATTCLQYLVKGNGEMQQLIEGATSAIDLPHGFLDQIETILRVDRHIGAEVEDAIETYITAVC